jgi:hypothetical protein
MTKTNCTPATFAPDPAEGSPWSWQISRSTPTPHPTPRPPPNAGVIVAIRGSVVDARFDTRLPPIYSVLRPV